MVVLLAGSGYQLETMAYYVRCILILDVTADCWLLIARFSVLLGVQCESVGGDATLLVGFTDMPILLCGMPLAEGRCPLSAPSPLCNISLSTWG